jgi:hypothetical protein
MVTAAMGQLVVFLSLVFSSHRKIPYYGTIIEGTLFCHVQQPPPPHEANDTTTLLLFRTANKPQRHPSPTRRSSRIS